MVAYVSYLGPSNSNSVLVVGSAADVDAFVVSVSDFSEVLFFSAHDIVDTSNVSGSSSASAFFITTLLYVKCGTIIPSLNTVNNVKLLYHIFS